MALGCDSSNASDHHDVLKQAALAAGIARDTRIDPTRFGAHQAFELATIRGAEAIGMGDRIGSLEPGKLADVVVHDARTLDWIRAVTRRCNSSGARRAHRPRRGRRRSRVVA